MRLWEGGVYQYLWLLRAVVKGYWLAAAPLSHLWYPVSLTSTLPGPTEAAFTLLLYCELLQWEERPLREFLHYPSQTEWQRKEGLCRKIIHYFNKGKVGSFSKPFTLQLLL